ncbi:MAG: hypothetical protein AB7E95_01115 [Kiritimatiellales bacterium]
MKQILTITVLAILMTIPAMAEPQGHFAARSTESGSGYYEAGVKFSTWSDLTALFRPSRWKQALEPGGMISWVNPLAWSKAPARTGKVLLGEVVVVGAVVGVAVAGGGGGGGGSSSTGGTPSGTGGGGTPSTPPTPSP